MSFYHTICICAHPDIPIGAVGAAQCRRCNGWKSQPIIFKVSDTPSGPEKNSGHPGTPGPPNNKEIA